MIIKVFILKSFDKELIIYLFIPLVFLVGVCIFLHIFINWDGFFLNLTTEIIGIIITVLYVDYILKRQKAILQAPVDENINIKISLFFNSCFTAIRTSLGFDDDAINNELILSASDQNRYRMFINKIIRETIEPNLLKNISALDQNGWSILDSNMKIIFKEANDILKIFGQRLEPNIYAKIMEIQECARVITLIYHSLNDVSGVTTEENEKIFLSETIFEEIQKMLNLITSMRFI